MILLLVCHKKEKTIKKLHNTTTLATGKNSRSVCVQHYVTAKKNKMRSLYSFSIFSILLFAHLWRIKWNVAHSVFVLLACAAVNIKRLNENFVVNTNMQQHIVIAYCLVVVLLVLIIAKYYNERKIKYCWVTTNCFSFIRLWVVCHIYT